MKELFDQYYDKSLSEVQRAEFELMLKGDAEFKKDFEEYSIGRKAISALGDDLLKSRLQGMHERLFSEDPKVKRLNFFQRNPIIYAAAAITVLIGLYVVFSLTGTSTPQELYAQHFEPMELVSNSRSGENDELLKFKDAYSSGDYNTALASLENVRAKDQVDYLTAMYKGICLQQVDPPQWNSSIESLEKVFESDNDFHNQARWYIALAYMASDQKEEAKSIFEELSKSNYKKEKIKTILSEL